MSWVLLGNDDGVDSPALLPFARALEQALDLPVRICVPAFERSWSSKAVTRHGHVRAEVVQREGRDVAAVDGTPADAVQLGMYSLFAEEFAGAPPRVVVTGINLGYNSGTAFLASSGTVWAAAEAALAGLPAIAVSTGPSAGMDDFASWRHIAKQAAAARDWERVAGVAADTVRDVAEVDLLEHCDLVSVNLPWSATLDTGRTVTDLAPLAYGPLLEPIDDWTWEFTTDLAVHHGETHGPGDVAALRAGRVSVTPVLLPRSAAVPDATRAAVERR
jgi:5'-nucleotidase